MNSGIFNQDFYPTPLSVWQSMYVDCKGKKVYDPSAGVGNLLEYALNDGATGLYATEIEPKFRDILANKYTLIGQDFLSVQSQDISHIDAIIMNPPFSQDVKHILHAYNIAPKGCEIYALCNYQSLDNDYSRERKELLSIIQNYGESCNLGSVFSNAERRTNVDVGFIRISKGGEAGQDYSDFFSMEADEEFGGEEGLIPHNNLREIVQRYVNSLQLFDRFSEIREQMNSVNKPLNLEVFNVSVSYQKNVLTKEQFVKELQKKYWQHVFNLMKVEKYLTQGTKDDLNKFIELHSEYPFTMKNISSMINVILQTREQVLDKALIEAVENFTKHTHENRYNVEGWKTNSGYMLNKKIIIGYICELNFNAGLGIREWDRHFRQLDDLIKVLCFITGTNYDNIPNIKYSSCDRDENGYLTESGKRVSGDRATAYNDRILNYNRFYPNQWYDWGFFEFKVFKKGTMHLKFKNENDWWKLNKKYGELKGFSLPEKI